MQFITGIVNTLCKGYYVDSQKYDIHIHYGTEKWETMADQSNVIPLEPQRSRAIFVHRGREVVTFLL
jgi:hypothetical protein